MANLPVATLSTAGWVFNPGPKADALMAHFYESNKSQTSNYSPEAVISLKWLLEQHGSDIPKLCGAMRDALTDYFNRFFDSSDVDVIGDLPDGQSSGKVILRVRIAFMVGANQYNVAKELALLNGKFAGVIKANDQGQ